MSSQIRRTAGMALIATLVMGVSEAGPAGNGAHNSRNSLDWAGTYRGTLPCDDCDGIATRVTLLPDSRFTRSRTHLGTDTPPVNDSGPFDWDASGSRVTLHAEDGSTQTYQVGENVLFDLDAQGNRITGDDAGRHQLWKRSDPRIEGHRWVLVELEGEPVAAGEPRRTPHLVLEALEGRAAGSDGCNRFFGGYQLDENQAIAFGPLASTQMACPDMAVPDAFNRVLREADGYTLADGVLSLTKSGQPRARLQKDPDGEAGAE